MSKRIVILLCSMLMLMICLCFNAGAIPAAGYCGENIRYVYDAGSRSVVISGDGEMFDYEDGTDSPFYGTDIVSVIINENITSIGMNAFWGCENLEGIIIADSVALIGSSAFEGCSSLKDIILPKALTTIGKKAFMGCESLGKIIIPYSITVIPEYTFKWCGGLTSVVFLGDIERIGVDAFKDCGMLTSIHFGVKSEDINEAIINSVPDKVTVHGSDFRVTVKDCLTGETVASLYCDSCNKNIYSEESVNKYETHDFGEYVSDKNSTCVIDGTKTAICKRCASKDTLPDVGSSQGHSWNDWEKKTAASCTAEGERVRKCTACQATENEAIPAILHRNSYAVNGNSPSCTESGYSPGEFCPDCKSWISGHNTIPSTGHSGGVATCVKRAVCSVCREEYGNTDSKNHTSIVVSDGKAATCTENGYTESKRCDSCKQTILVKMDIEATGHKNETVAAIGATCTKDGLSEYKICSVCGVTTVDAKIIPAKGHNEKVVAGTAATCTDNGFTDKIVCTLCDEVISESEAIPAKGHSLVTVAGKEATCTVNGLTDGKKCSVCKTITNHQQKTPLKPHEYKISVEKKATFTLDGKTVLKCSCGAEKKNSAKTVNSIASCTLSKTSYNYDSKTKAPVVTVKDKAGNVLKNTVDYDVKYESGRKSTGKYTVTIIFKDKYSGSKNLYFTIAPQATSKISASQTASSITLSWNKVTGADGYRVYRYDSKSKKYIKIKDVTDRSLKISSLNSGTSYKFKVKAYKKDNGTIWGNASEAYSFSTKPAAPVKISCDSSSSSVTLKWKKVTGASGYAIYRYSSGEWKRIVTINSGSKVSCKIESLKSAAKYKFCIKAFRKSGDKLLYGSASESVTALTNPATPSLKVSYDKNSTATLKWSDVSGESGYQIYYSAEKDGKFRKIADNKADVTKYNVNGLESGQTYYFKIRSYRKTTEGILYSTWSSVCKVKVI